MFFGAIALRFALTNNVFINSLILTSWRALGSTAFIFLDIKEGDLNERIKSPLKSILKERSFVLYLIPWTIFSLVNYLSWDINAKVYGNELFQISVLIENIIAGVSAIVAGLFSDIKGRKLVTIGAFTLIGLGYAVLGIYPSNIISWCLYVVVDGVAWGIISVIFLFTIWGDLAYGKSSEKYYAIGILPYSLSTFMHLTVGPFISERISHYAIFSFAAFFLFLAVIPLMFAPETLPEKTLRERELRGYIERAKRVREKFTKG
jgi:MFS family permease